uniref:Caskin-2 n=1 Tax=Caenorhabditis tropicalis TaxID=1561998 RepID=A0A1I7T5K1_9PELO
MAKNFVDSKSVWIDEPDSKGQTALHLSITYSDPEMSSLILKGGANVDAVDHDGTTSCHIACKNGMIDHFNLLIYYHADICAVDRAGKTPFDLACEHGQEKSGIDVTITNTDGLTAFVWAKKNSNRNPITCKEIRFLLKNFHTFTNATAVEDFLGVEATELSFSKGDNVWVIERCTPDTWKGIVFGRKGNSRSGFFKSKIIKAEDTVDNCKSSLSKPEVETKKNHNKMSFRIAKNQKNATSTFTSKPVPLPVLPLRSSSTFPYSDINRNTPTQMTSFGRATSCYGDKHDHKMNNTTKSTFGCFSSESSQASRTSTPNPSNMYSSFSALYPNKMDNNYASIGSNSSQSSSGFESAKCSASTSASSFPYTQSAGSGYDFTHSTRSVESGSGSSSSIHILDDSFNRPTQEVDVTAMVQSGVPHAEILANWLDSINMNNYLAVFLKQGYDLLTIARCTPADLLALGIKNPDHRKKLITDIHSWKISDEWPFAVPNNNLREWLHAIALAEYIPLFESQQYSTVKDILDLQWEDFEDIGVKRLGHLKRFGLTIKKLKDHHRSSSSNMHTSQFAIQQHSKSYHATPSLQTYPSYSTNLQTPPVSTFRNKDPPPPAPLAPLRCFRASSDKIDYLSYQHNNWKSATALPDAPPKPICLPSKPKSTLDLFFGDDTPIKLNLVSTGKILSDISKLKKEEQEEQELDDPNECPPPPAPLHCNMHNMSFGNLSSFTASLDNDQFPFANENCGTVSDLFSIGSTKAPSIDEMLQDIQGAMDNLLSPSESHN